MVLRFMILCKGCPLGKQASSAEKKALPTDRFLSIIIALYRDDMIFSIASNGFMIQKAKRKISKPCREEGFRMCDWEEGTELNYLDITFDIKNDCYRPYKKTKHKC